MVTTVKKLPDGRFAAVHNGRCYGKYRTREAAARKLWQVEKSQRPARSLVKRGTPPPWAKVG